MNNQVFVDTSALIAIGNKRDVFHYGSSQIIVGKW